VSRPGTIAWFARHELRLAWRDWLAMMTAGGRTRVRTLAIVLAVLAAIMHMVAYSMVGRFAALGLDPDKAALVVITGSALLSWSLMLSQAMESVTRAFYTRSDLDLLLSSPAVAARAFSVRVAAIAVSVTSMSVLLAAPFIDVLAALGGARWLLAYIAVAALAAAAVGLAAVATTALFQVIGPKRTRLVAQIVAAVIGAGFVIGLQLAAIVSHGTLSRFAVLASQPFVGFAPDIGSVVWWPARALIGDVAAVAGVLGGSILLLGASIAIVAPRFADCATAAAGAAPTAARQRRHAFGFRSASPAAMLRRKEWTLLRRDPWLVSQTLMQLLYLLPPAFLLWRGFGGEGASEVLLVPVLVMAAGQLAGGLA
jgi:ABC-2 type transport system permease protein